LSPQDTAALVDHLCSAGIDFIKDDELQSDGPACPFADRAHAVMQVINAHADRTGRKVMYAFNLTGDIDQMRHRHDLVQSLGGTCVMASLIAVGMAGIVALRRHAVLPLHAHRNGWGALTRAPLLGFDHVAWSKLWRIAGVDHMHVNGLQNKFCEGDDSVIASARSLQTPLWPDHPMTVMPVFSSGQTVAQVHGTWAALQSIDLIHAAGGGIMAHPFGPAGGVAAMRAAWDAAQAGISLELAARDDKALAAAVSFSR
jgi:ribulose-bisphosphate carboxylase large chain